LLLLLYFISDDANLTGSDNTRLRRATMERVYASIK